MVTKKLKNKRILITAGPTWVPLDSVRVISNLATGETGILLAEKLQGLGAKVTLLLGPAQSCCLNKSLRLIRFKFFEDLCNIIKKELKTKRYDAVIHSAAVSDYKPKPPYAKKVKSGLKHWKINLIPTPKIIDLIKWFNPSTLAAGFKFEAKAGRSLLIKKAKELAEHANLDLVVANTMHKGKYRAYIIDSKRVLGPMLSKEAMAKKLVNLIGDTI